MAHAPRRPAIAVLTTLDTKGEETRYLADRIRALGGDPVVVDMGVVGTPAFPGDVPRARVAEAGGKALAEILAAPTRQAAAPVMIAGATRILEERLAAGALDGVVGLGGTQGTSNCSRVMRSLPYGLPKVMVSTVASGDTSAFVDIKDVTMMFSVGDLLGLNPLTRKILANAAGAVVGMARSEVSLDTSRGARPTIGMTNLGVLTEGATLALDLFRKAGYEVMVFHAVGSGGRAMEQLMKEGLIGAVFDYALGEITDEIFHGLRAAGPERLTVAGTLGLPQVLCPGGAEHVGFIVPPNEVPERWSKHLHVFHSPIVFAPRVDRDEFVRVAKEVKKRLAATGGRATLLLPLRGTSRYSVAGGPLHDPEGDRAFFDELRRDPPAGVEVVDVDAHAEDPVFVRMAVERLVALIEGR